MFFIVVFLRQNVVCKSGLCHSWPDSIWLGLTMDNKINLFYYPGADLEVSRIN